MNESNKAAIKTAITISVGLVLIAIAVLLEGPL